jgi:hypothetical protein
MALIAVAADKGAPGVTTASVALAAVWPRPVLLAECDPAGGDLVYRLPAADGGRLDPRRGLLSLAVAARRGLQPHQVWEHAQKLRGGLDILAGVGGAEQGSGLEPLWGSVGRVLAAAPQADVIADCGRVGVDGPVYDLLAQASTVILLTRVSLGEVIRLRDRVSVLAAALRRRGRPAGRIDVVVITDYKNFGAAIAEVGQALRQGGAPGRVVGGLAYEPKSADQLRGEWSGKLDKSMFIRTARAIAGDLASALPGPLPGTLRSAPTASPAPGPASSPPPTPARSRDDATTAAGSAFQPATSRPAISQPPGPRTSRPSYPAGRESPTREPQSDPAGTDLGRPRHPVPHGAPSPGSSVRAPQPPEAPPPPAAAPVPPSAAVPVRPPAAASVPPPAAAPVPPPAAAPEPSAAAPVPSAAAPVPPPAAAAPSAAGAEFLPAATEPPAAAATQPPRTAAEPRRPGPGLPGRLASRGRHAGSSAASSARTSSARDQRRPERDDAQQAAARPLWPEPASGKSQDRPKGR